MEKKALVVGSGFGGIASALRLRRLGFQVTILERLDQIGGRARVFKKSGYTFDAGIFNSKISDTILFGWNLNFNCCCCCNGHCDTSTNKINELSIRVINKKN